jgi:hypothetical protein
VSSEEQDQRSKIFFEKMQILADFRKTLTANINIFRFELMIIVQLKKSVNLDKIHLSKYYIIDKIKNMQYLV